MKKIYSAFLRVLCATLAVVSSNPHSLLAQSCAITGSSPVPSTHSTWNWEEPRFNPGNTSITRNEYCQTWTAFVNSSTATPFKVAMGAPWDNSSSPNLLAIQYGFDYKKANGWELLKFDFGAGTRPTPVPYFALYQKTTGTVRVYAYINNSNLLTGLVFTLKHSDTNTTYSGASTASLSLSQYPLLAPDKYLSRPTSDPVSKKEVLTYVSFYSGSQQWAMGQFNILLDPNISNRVYNLNTLQFQIAGLVKSEVLLNGSFQFSTDYALSGSADKVNPPTDPTKIFAEGQKYLGSITSLSTALGKVNEDATKFSNGLGNNPTGVLKSLKSSADNIVAVTSGKTLKAITDAAGTLGSFFGLAGSLIGLLGDDSAGATGSAAFVPTVSKGTIQLTGSITVTSPLITFNLLTPGSNHYDANSGSTATPISYYTQLPYYNCPLGIFNLATTPTLKKVDYTRYSRTHAFRGYPDFTRLGQASDDPTVSCTSYQLNAPITPVVNNASGLAIRSVKYAICKVVLLADLQVPYVTQSEPQPSPFDYRRDYKFIYSQVINGALEAYPLAPSSPNTPATVLVQTPFADAHCSEANALPFNSPTQTPDSPVFLRVIAELVPATGPASTAPIYFTQDYAVNLIDDPNSSSYQNRIYKPGEQPPYNLLTFSPTGGGISNPSPPATLSPYPRDITEPTLTLSGQLTYAGSGTAYPLGQVANSTLIFDNSTSISIQKTNLLKAVIFRAKDEVQIRGQLTAPQGNDALIITTDLAEVSYAYAQAKRSCLGPVYDNQYTTFDPQCGYDFNATSKTGPATTQLPATSPALPPLAQLLAYPNPATQRTMVQLVVAGSECIDHLELLDMAGKINWHKQYQCAHEVSAEISLAGLSKGIYIINATTNKHVYSTKLSIE